MKRFIAIYSVFLIMTSFGFAEEAADHPLVGRFDGASIQHQEISRFGEYAVAVSEEETKSIQGEVWMTLYNAPEDSSTFSIYSTYLSFLEQEGFEILLSYKPGEAPGRYMRDSYERNPFADHGNYSHSAPITSGNNDTAAFLAAHKETADGDIYVGIAIKAGWNEYPQYKLDVVKTAQDSGRIIVEEDADHPLAGRYEGAKIQHQEKSKFGEYTIAVSEEETRNVQGEVWMTLYRAPERTSTFSIYATYLSYFEKEGFEILLSYKPGETPGRYLRDTYERNPFADHGNYSHSAPFTSGNDYTAAYIAARRETPGGEIYVSIAIKAGWSSYPQYKLDLAGSGSDAGKIVSSGTQAAAKEEDTDTQSPVLSSSGKESAGAPPAGDSAGADTLAGIFASGTGSFRLRGGAVGFMFLDPNFAGTLSEFDDGTDVTVMNNGFKNVHGFFAEAAWFPNRNTGLALTGTHLVSDINFTSGGEAYKSSAQLEVFRLSAITRIIGTSYPASIEFGVGGGLAFVDLEQVFTAVPDVWIGAEDLLPVISVSVDTTIPVLDFAHLTAGMDYLFIPFDEFTMKDSMGPTSITYHEGNLGGLMLKLGLVMEF